MYLINLTGMLRVSKEGELQGLDLHEHGISAYPEYVISTPVGSPATEPKPATVPPHGRRRFAVVVEGVSPAAVATAWESACQPNGQGSSPDFLAVYPNMTTVSGNRFRFRGGDADQVRASLERLLRTYPPLKAANVRVEAMA